MRLTLSRLVWALAAVFAAIVAVEAVRPVAPTVASVPASPASRTAAPVSAQPVAAWTSAMLARPLFSPDRRPPPPAAVAAATADAPQSLPRLAGIIVSSRGRTAIFANGSDHSTIAGEGGAVGEWRVKAIHAETVDLSGPEGERTVKPSYSNDPTPAPAFTAGFTPGVPFTPPAGNLLPTPTSTPASGPNGRPLNGGQPFGAATLPNNAPGAVSRNRQ